MEVCKYVKMLTIYGPEVCVDSPPPGQNVEFGKLKTFSERFS